LAQETGVLLEYAFRTTRLIKLCLHKMTNVHELQQLDCAARILFCNWLLQNVYSLTTAVYNQHGFALEVMSVCKIMNMV
jgi:hypothetical protein